MSTNSYMLEVGSVEALVLRKRIKHLYLSVLPPLGMVRVTAPVGMNDDAIRTLLATRLAWVKRQISKFERQERQTKREFVSGESHYFLGRRYRLEVVYKDEPARVEIRGKNKLLLHVRPKSNREKREEVLLAWYRQELRSVLSQLLNHWQEATGLQVEHWGIKRMKTRWGTCNKNARRIWLNLELAKKPLVCIEYVVVHELMHLVEKKHSEKFVELLSLHLPKWKSIKEELNRLILSHEKWEFEPEEYLTALSMKTSTS